MRRIVAYGIGIAAIPVGTILGVWMAQLTNAPPCPVKGLGTAALCVAQPAFAPSTCVLCGAAAAAVFLLLSIALYRPASLTPAFDLAAAGGGVLVGLWASSIVAFPDGIGGLRFSSWESALIGAAAAVVIFGLGCLGSPDICRVNLDVARRVQGWLFKDLSMSAAAVEGHETNAQ